MSAPSKTVPQAGLTHPGLLMAVRAGALLALGLSAYLAWTSLSGGRAIGCGPESGCDRVLNSRWAYWFGVPVSAFAMATYLVILGATLQLGRTVPVPAQRRAWMVLVPAGLLVMGAALWFVALQLLVLKSICWYCMSAHTTGFVTGLLLLFGAPIGNPPEKPWQIRNQVFVPSRMMGRMILFALGGLGVLIAGQIAHAPPTSREVKQADILAKAPPVSPALPATNPPPPSNPPPALPAPPPPVASVKSDRAVPNTGLVASSSAPTPTPTPPPAPALPPKPAPPIPVNGMLSVYDGRFGVAVNEVPVIGSSTNPFAIVSLFDYTCHHCRQMHPILQEAQRGFRDQVVILSLPMPLDPECNQTMTRTHPDHVNACAYARLGLQVWRADRSKHQEFDDWLFTGEKPPAIGDAREKARELVGPEAFDRAAADPWVNAQLKLDVAIYELAYRSGQGSMPQLIIGPTVAVGTYPLEELKKVFANKLGLKPQP